MYSWISIKLCNHFKKRYKEYKAFFLFNETLIFRSLQSFYLNNKLLKIPWGFLKHQNTYTKPLNTLAMLGKLES
jgi:hypothetical protein